MALEYFIKSTPTTKSNFQNTTICLLLRPRSPPAQTRSSILATFLPSKFRPRIFKSIIDRCWVNVGSIWASKIDLGGTWAKRSTFDFEQPSNKSHAVCPRKVPGRCQNRFQNRFQNDYHRFLAPKRTQNGTKTTPEETHLQGTDTPTSLNLLKTGLIWSNLV